MTILQTAEQPLIVLVPGYWLGAWAWDDILVHLESLGARTRAVTLPGLDPRDPDRLARTLEDQASALERILDEEAGDVVLAAHSGANGPVTLVQDRRPDRIRRVIWIDSGPAADGGAFAPDLPEEALELPLPPFEALGVNASTEGLDQQMLERFRERAVSQPASVARAEVRLSSEQRWEVPTTFVCCSLPSAQVQSLAQSGHPMFADVARLEDVTMVDLPTGHWPMWSRPAELAEAVLTAASAPAGRG